MNWLKDLKEKKERERIRQTETHANEDLQIEANRLRREQELAKTEMQRRAHRELLLEKEKLELQKAQEALKQQRHDMGIRALSREGKVNTIREDSIDVHQIRELEREKRAIALREAQRAEKEATSTVQMTVKENLITENGKVVGAQKEISRIRSATTEEEADALFRELAGDFQYLKTTEGYVPRVTAGAEQKLIGDDGSML